jgi:hypothetical protein
VEGAGRGAWLGWGRWKYRVYYDGIDDRTGPGGSYGWRREAGNVAGMTKKFAHTWLQGDPRVLCMRWR